MRPPAKGELRGGLRIIAGDWRGRRIATPPGDSTRPTSDRARETLFSMLNSRMGGFTGRHVADMFAGSGALGFEALSRGAASCLFIEQDRLAAEILRKNIAALDAIGASVSQSSAFALPRAPQPYDLIFLDPPYGTDGLAALLDALASGGWLAPGAYVSLETAVGEAAEPQTLELVTDRKVGKAFLRIFRSAI